jgi:photosystem II stability/assembly factor-like uncharacterized protein
MNSSGHVILALPEPRRFTNEEGDQPRHLYRSTDDGTSWQSVLTVVGEDAPVIVPSPSVADDARLYLLDGALLFESSDAGGTWKQRELVAGQYIQTIGFSPAFATDRTIFAASVGGASDPAAQIDASQLSTGVIVSRDAGATWSPVSDGLEIADARYRDVRSLAISPAFDQDRALFAFALGPLERYRDGPCFEV